MFGKSFKLFTLFGFPVKIDLSWVIIAVLLTWSLASGFFPTAYGDLSTSTYWAMGVIGAIGLFISIVLHEFAHSLVARRHGLPMGGITLFIFGGVAEMQDEPKSPKAELQVAVAGPIASILIAAVFFGIRQLGLAVGWPTPVTGVLSYLALINTVLVIFNLIPAFPLDGGRVLRSILWEWKNNLRKATRITSRLGAGFGMALLVLGILNILAGGFVAGMWWVVLGLFLRGAAQMSFQQLLIRRSLEGEPVRRFMIDDPITVPPKTPVSDLVEDYMYRHHHRMFPVTENGHLMGCVSSRDVGKVAREKWAETPVEEICEPCGENNTVSPEEEAVDVLSRIQRTGTSRLMVVRDEKLEGVLTLKDLIQFLSLKLELEEGEDAAQAPQILARAQA
jgi:Zn-dependent protease